MKIATQIQKIRSCSTMMSCAIGVTGVWKYHGGAANAAPGKTSDAAIAAKRCHRADSVRSNTMLVLVHDVASPRLAALESRAEKTRVGRRALFEGHRC